MTFARNNEKAIHESFNSPLVTTILGPRRVGKTTLVTRFIEQQPNFTWAVFNMDEFDLRQKIEKDGILKAIEQQTLQKIGAVSTTGENKKIWVVIDEAQKCPKLFDQIKIIYDKFKDKNVIKFILTGSALLQLHQLSAESLAGRIELHHLYPFTLKETCSLLFPQASLPNTSTLDLIFANAHININNFASVLDNLCDNLSPFQTILQNALSTQLIWGGLPEILLEQEEKKRLMRLANYIQTYLEKDIRALTTITDLNLYQNLIQIIAQQTGSVRQDKRITDTLACKADTLKKYRGFLQATLLYREVYPFIASPLKRLIKSPKGYLIDNGLISYLTNIFELSTLTQTGLIGNRLENWFLNELQVALARSPHFNNIFFWRTSGGTEVDFVVQHGNNIFPFEVTYSNKPLAKKINNLQSFLQNFQVPVGFYIYNGDYYFDQQKHIHFLPAWIIN